MADLTREFDRRSFLKAAGMAGAAVGLGSLAAACATPAASVAPSPSAAAGGASAAAPSSAAASQAAAIPSGTFNWLTWGDHWYQAEMDKIAADVGIKSNITSFSDNIDAYTGKAVGKIDTPDAPNSHNLTVTADGKMAALASLTPVSAALAD